VRFCSGCSKNGAVARTKRVNSTGFQRFPAAGTRVALQDEKLNSLADQNPGRTKMFAAMFPSSGAIFARPPASPVFPIPKD
jgi:hypothetical protein